MLEATDTEHAPWHIARSDDKRRARLDLIAHFLSLISYEEVGREKVELPKRSKKTPTTRWPRSRTGGSCRKRLGQAFLMANSLPSNISSGLNNVCVAKTYQSRERNKNHELDYRHRLALSGGMSVEHLDLAAIAKPAS